MNKSTRRVLSGVGLMVLGLVFCIIGRTAHIDAGLLFGAVFAALGGTMLFVGLADRDA